MVPAIPYIVSGDSGGDGSPNVRVFNIQSGGVVTLSHVSVADGLAGDNGGGIRNEGSLALDTVTIANNESSLFGGGIHNLGTLVLNNTMVATNTAILGGGFYNQGTVTVNQSEFFGNWADVSGGGVRNTGTANVDNSTFWNNTAHYNGAAILDSGILTLTHSTVVSNTADADGNGIGSSAIAGESDSTIMVNASLIAGNLVTTTLSHIWADCHDTGGDFIDGGYNLFGHNTGCPTDSGTSQTVDAGALYTSVLASLDAYGGNTRTFALLPGSPAIDAIPAGNCVLNTDQRGVDRPQVDGCDIGAFESQSFGLTISSGNNQIANTGVAFAQPLVATVTAKVAVEPIGAGRVISFTAPASGAGLITTFTGTTNNSNVVSATVTANNTTGSYVVSATARGVITPALFSLTNFDLVDLTIDKSVSITTADPGQTITYSLAFSNASSDTARGVVITDYMPVSVTVQSVISSSDVAITRTQTGAVFETAPVSSGEGGVITITGILSEPLAVGTFTNTASIAAETTEVATTNNTAEAGLTVQNIAPSLEAISNQTIAEMEILTFTLDAVDQNGEGLAFGLLDAPGGTSIDATQTGVLTSTGVFTWTPTEAQGPDVYTFTVVVSDTGVLTDTQEIVVTVTEVNTAPVLAAIGNQTISETVELSFTASAADADLPAQTFSYGLVNAPSGAGINSGSGDFSWTPTVFQGPNTYTFTVVVSDTGSPVLTDSEEIMVTVNGENDAPVITEGSLITVTMAEDSDPTPFSLTLNASDPNESGEALSWNILTNAFSGTASVNGAGLSKTVAYTPTADVNGFDNFVVQVSDGSLTDTIEVSVTIQAVNDPPTFTHQGDQTTAPLTNTQQTVSGWVSSYDVGPPDEEAVQSVKTYTRTVLYGGDLFSVPPSVAAGGTLTYTPNGRSGSAYVIVWMQDDGGTSNGGDDWSDDGAFFSITIPGANLFLSKAVTPTIAEPGQTIIYTLNFANVGDISATNVVITDFIPGEATVQNVASSGDVSISHTTVQTAEVFETANIPAEQGGIITITAQVSSSLTTDMVFTNTAAITSTSAEGNLDNNTAEVGVEVIIPPDLAITKTVALSGASAIPGDPITYTIVVANSGGDAENVSVQDFLPGGIDGPPLNWTGTVSGNKSLTFTISANIATDAGYGSTILNTASFNHVSSNGSDTAGLTTISDTTPPDISGVTLITPTNGITVTDARPTFDWDDATDTQSGVFSYTVFFTSSNDSLDVQEASDTVTTSISGLTPSVDLANGVYTWTVKAHDAAGNASGYVSPAVSFILAASDEVYLPLVVKDN